MFSLRVKLRLAERTVYYSILGVDNPKICFTIALVEHVDTVRKAFHTSNLFGDDVACIIVIADDVTRDVRFSCTNSFGSRYILSIRGFAYKLVPARKFYYEVAARTERHK